jgi:hypothetical protein
MWNIKALALAMPFKSYSQGLRFWQMTERQNDREDKNNMPPIFDLGGIKIFSEFLLFCYYLSLVKKGCPSFVKF